MKVVPTCRDREKSAPVSLQPVKVASERLAPVKRALLRSQDFQAEDSSLAAVKLAVAPRQPAKRVFSSCALVKSVPLKLQRSNRPPVQVQAGQVDLIENAFAQGPVSAGDQRRDVGSRKGLAVNVRVHGGGLK